MLWLHCILFYICTGSQAKSLDLKLTFLFPSCLILKLKTGLDLLSSFRCAQTTVEIRVVEARWRLQAPVAPFCEFRGLFLPLWCPCCV